jgi:hypothetical protein
MNQEKPRNYDLECYIIKSDIWSPNRRFHANLRIQAHRTQLSLEEYNRIEKYFMKVGSHEMLRNDGAFEWPKDLQFLSHPDKYISVELSYRVVADPAIYIRNPIRRFLYRLGSFLSRRSAG